MSTRVGLIIVWLLAIDLLQHLDRGTILEYSHKLLVDIRTSNLCYHSLYLSFY